jgi:hypothetical protein
MNPALSINAWCSSHGIKGAERENGCGWFSLSYKHSLWSLGHKCHVQTAIREEGALMYAAPKS